MNRLYDHNYVLPDNSIKGTLVQRNHATEEWYTKEKSATDIHGQTRIKTNSDRIVLGAWKSYSNGKFVIVYQSCLF
ncbi:MAG: hypothetical protein QOH96_1486 [Blastocatellia bacterium]|jgi:hypothetical protein|nr:hypothetical protein [Blastocatellia bacterium]